MSNRNRAQAGVRIEPVAEGDELATISIMGEIGYDVTAEDVFAAVAQAQGKPLMVNVFSYGGDAAQGLAINQILNLHPAHVTTNVLGVAASSASVIAAAGDERIVPANGAVMVHNPWGITVGDAAAHRRSAAELDGMEQAYLLTYANATGRSMEELKPYMAEERWIYGEEAVVLGFATKVSSAVTAFASISPPPADRFKQMPAALRTLAGIPEPPAAPATPEPARPAEPIPEPEPVTILTTELPSTPPPPALSMTVETSQADAVLAERDRIQAIQGMVATHDLPADFAHKLINDGNSVADARTAVLARLAATKGSGVQAGSVAGGAVASMGAAGIGMTTSDAQQYNIMNVVRYLTAEGHNKTRAASDAGYELEWSQEAEKRYGRSPNGVFIPHEVIAGGVRRIQAANVGNLSAGGALVGADRLDGSFIDYIRASSAFLSSGATVLSGLQGNVEIGRQTGTSIYYFVGEDVDVTASDLSFGLVNMSPKTIGVRVPVSRRLMLQSSPDIDTLVRNDIFEQLTIGVDKTIGYGTGSSSQPLGLRNINGIAGVAFSGGETCEYSDEQGGGTASSGTWRQYVSLETKIANANLNTNAMQYLMNTATRGGCKTTLKDAAANATYVFEGGQINGYQVRASNQIQQNDVFFGNWNDLLIGFWSGIDLVVDNMTQAAKGQTIFTVMQDFDVAARRSNSFALGT